MGLIKSTHTPSSITPFSMADIERHAKRVLMRAQQQAEQLLAAAQAEAELIRQQAQAEGLAQGTKQGVAEGTEQGKQAGLQQALAEHRAKLQQAVQSVSSAMSALNASRDELEAGALAEVVKLSLAIARRVIKRESIADPQILIGNLADVMKLVIQCVDIRIAIHPAQRSTLDAALPQLRLTWPNLTHVKIIDDASLEPGGCRVLTENGAVDADIWGQLDRITAELLPGTGD
jgi:flagellar biosynthesis/type III secretory pathway protein FliH